MSKELWLNIAIRLLAPPLCGYIVSIVVEKPFDWIVILSFLILGIIASVWGYINDKGRVADNKLLEKNF